MITADRIYSVVASSNSRAFGFGKGISHIWAVVIVPAPSARALEALVFALSPARA